MVRRSGIVE